MKIYISIYNFESEILEDIGYIEIDRFDADKCFHLCNWSHWSNKKPVELHSDILATDHGICFTNPETKEKWLAKSIGWFIGNDTNIINYIKEHKDRLVWS